MNISQPSMSEGWSSPGGQYPMAGPGPKSRSLESLVLGRDAGVSSCRCSPAATRPATTKRASTTRCEPIGIYERLFGEVEGMLILKLGCPKKDIAKAEDFHDQQPLPSGRASAVPRMLQDLDPSFFLAAISFAAVACDGLPAPPLEDFLAE